MQKSFSIIEQIQEYLKCPALLLHTPCCLNGLVGMLYMSVLKFWDLREKKGGGGNLPQGRMRFFSEKYYGCNLDELSKKTRVTFLSEIMAFEIFSIKKSH